MVFLYYNKNNSDFIFKNYGIDALNIETNFKNNSYLLVPHTLEYDEYISMFYKYKNYNIIFLLDFTFEPYTDLSLVEPFYRAADSLNVNYNKLIMLYNNLYKTKLNTYLHNQKYINTLSFPRWLFEKHLIKKDVIQDRFNLNTNSFSCFNRLGRGHKKKIVDYIGDINLDSFTTYKISEDYPTTNRNISEIPEGIHENITNNWFYKGKVNICVETLYYSVINNNSCFDDILHITEKTMRNIMLKIPFVLVGNRYTLARMRSFGFKTFNSIIDESYDEMDDSIRYIKSIESGKQLLSVWDSDEVQYILDYNWNILTSKNHINTLFDSLFIFPLKKHMNNLV